VRHAKIVLVAEWDGWCGACAADRPLVLTRTGRQRLRTWLTGAADDSRPLVVTCRLCGTGVPVPLEQDDPPVVLGVDDLEQAPTEPSVERVEAGPTEVPAGGADVVSRTVDADAAAGHRAVATALGALLAQRSAAAVVRQLPPAAALVAAPVPAVAPLLPLQRTPALSGLTELQLLAEGIDLLSAGRD